MPGLKKLHAETHDKIVLWIGVNDEGRSRMNAFGRENDIPWSGNNDADSSIGKALGPHSIPLEVLIDAFGKVAYYEIVYDIANPCSATVKLVKGSGSVAIRPERQGTSEPLAYFRAR